MGSSEEALRKYIETSGIRKQFEGRMVAVRKQVLEAIDFNVLLDVIVPGITMHLTEADIAYLAGPIEEMPTSTRKRTEIAMEEAQKLLARYVERVCRDIFGTFEVSPNFMMNAPTGRPLPVKDIPACRRTIEAIYRKHGFIVEEWTDDLLKCRITSRPELDDLPADKLQERLNTAWKEIDAVIHEVTE